MATAKWENVSLKQYVAMYPKKGYKICKCEECGKQAVVGSDWGLTKTYYHEISILRDGPFGSMLGIDKSCVVVQPGRVMQLKSMLAKEERVVLNGAKFSRGQFERMKQKSPERYA